MFIQQLGTLEPFTCMSVLEECVRFYTYSKFKMVATEMDDHIVTTHLQNCLKYLVELYRVHIGSFDDVKLQSCLHVYASYVLLNIHQPDIILSVFDMLPSNVRCQEPLRQALGLAIAALNQNYLRVFRYVDDFHCSRNFYLLMSVYNHLTEFRANFLRTLSFSHHSKACKFPISVLSKWLCLTEAQTAELCRSHGLTIIGKDFVKFFKTDFTKPCNTKHECLLYCDIIKVCDTIALHSL